MSALSPPENARQTAHTLNYTQAVSKATRSALTRQEAEPLPLFVGTTNPVPHLDNLQVVPADLVLPATQRW